jgi:ADP-ribosylglycohydrolase
MNSVVCARSRALGAMVGLCAGDKNGGPLRMGLLLAESLLLKHELDDDAWFESLRGWFKGEDVEPCFDSGPTFVKVMSAAIRTGNRRQAVEVAKSSAGPNAAHRVAAVACFRAVLDKDVADVAARQARVTHVHEEAVFGSVIVAVVLRGLINGRENIVELAVEASVNAPDALKKAMLNPDLYLSNGGHVVQTLASALLFCRSAKTFEEGLLASVRFAGGANYCPVIVGCWLGARFGAKSIPERELEHLNSVLRSRVQRAAETLANDWDE